MNSKDAASYVTLRHGVKVRRTLQIGPGLLVDVDADWKVVGIENVGRPVGWSQLVDVIRAIPLTAQSPYDRTCSACQAEPVPPKTPCPEGFHWIGQSGAWCDKCGLPIWEHEGMARLRRSPKSPFDDANWELDPWKPGDREALRKRWEPELPAHQARQGAKSGT